MFVDTLRLMHTERLRHGNQHPESESLEFVSRWLAMPLCIGLRIRELTAATHVDRQLHITAVHVAAFVGTVIAAEDLHLRVQSKGKRGAAQTSLRLFALGEPHS